MNPIKTNNLPKILLNNPLLLFSLLFGQICFSNLLIGQSDSAKFEQYPFVHYELNHFTGSENSIAFNAFYEKFDRMMRFKTGKLNIVHFGGSHIQADIWSNYLRERLQTIDTNVQGARGIVFPFKAAGTNAPYSYSVNTQGQWDGFRSSYNKHESTWGVSGITATTSDTLAGLKFTFEKAINHVTSNQFTLLSNLSSTGYKVIYKGDLEKLHMSVDTTSEGYLIFHLPAPVDSIELQFTKSKSDSSELQFYGLVLDNSEPGITYHSIGVNGSRFVSFQRCELFEEQIKYLAPDLIIMSIGTNDSSEPDYDSTSYKTNFKLFLDQILAVNPDCAIMLTMPNDNFVRRKYHNDNLASVRSVIYELANEYDARVWDLYGIMGGSGSAKAWMQEGMMKPDLVHFTKAGYLLKGELFYEAFLNDHLRWYNDLDPIWSE